ncbi:MAG TPA: VOC family protein [Fimbriimonas sp.]|nr:VOC family protein [Fimbriimonas sp.]
MSEESAMKTAVNWYEVSTHNVESATNFYEAVFGWTHDSMPMGDMTYNMLKTNDVTFAGVMDLSHPSMEGVPPNWALYFHTDNCQATMDKVKELGGEIVYGPMDIPDIGTAAGCKDCCGAYFNIHQPLGERGDLMNGGVNWVEHMGPNREKAVSFYSSLFGWGSNDMDMGEGIGIYTMFMEGAAAIGGCMEVPDPNVPPNWCIYLHSSGLEETLEKVAANGGNVIQPIMDIGQFGRIAIAADCCGAVFGIHQPPAM